jgi:hypothetical protein
MKTNASDSQTWRPASSLPDADPRSRCPRCGGRESKFLAAGVLGVVAFVLLMPLPHALSEPIPAWQGSVLEFNGANRVTISSAPSLNPPQLTVECRASFDRIGVEWNYTQALVAKGGDGGAFDGSSNGAYRLWQLGGGIGFGFGYYAFDLGIAVPVPLVTRRWYDIAGSYDGNTIRMYLDGVFVGSKVIGNTSVGNSLPVYLGQQYGSYSYPFDGQMDEVRIWNYARTASEIQATTGMPLTGSESGLVAYWNFNETLDSQLVTDLTANGNNGSLGSTLSIEALDPTRVAVPEPSAALLACFGLGALASRRNRKLP